MIVVGVALFIYKVRDDSDLFQTSYTITMVYTTIYIVYLCNETFLFIYSMWLGFKVTSIAINQNKNV